MSTSANNLDAQIQSAISLHKAGHLDQAQAILEQIIQQHPGHADGLNLLGAVKVARGDYVEAVKSLQAAIRHQPAKAGPYVNLGVALERQGKLKPALHHYQHALRLKPSLVAAHYNLANVFKHLHRPIEAIKAYKQALTLAPDHAEARLNLGALQLGLGDFSEGWTHYEWRWQSSDCAMAKPHWPWPAWQGQPLTGGLLVWGEQGVGDQILFAGLLEEAAARVGHLTVTVDPRLVPLLQRSLPGIDVQASGQPLERERYQAQIALGSLGQFFRTQAGDFTRSRSPYLAADPQRVQAIKTHWQDVPRPWTGLAWRSVNPRLGAEKSLTLDQLQPLMNAWGGGFIDLQYGDTAEERQQLKAVRGIDLWHYAAIDNFADLDGLAALIAACDRVVTISNVTAHLAGALGTPTRLMLPTGAMSQHWYWYAPQQASVWYPGLDVYRQDHPGQWLSVVQRIIRTSNPGYRFA